MQSIDFQGLTFTPDLPVSTYSLKNIEDVETRLEFTFPEDYREFINILGIGETEFHVKALPLQDNYLFSSGELASHYWFWDASSTILTRNYAMECVNFFGSSDGDQIIFHPSNRNRWFILPHEKEEVIVVSSFQQLYQHYVQIYDDLLEPFQFEVWPWSEI